MSRTAVALLLLAVLTAGPARAEEAHAFVEVRVSKDAVFVQEPVRVQVRIGIDSEFFEAHAVPLFRQQMDVPVQVTAPWLDALPGATRVEETEREGVDPRRQTLAVSDRVTEAVRVDDEIRAGRTFTVLELSTVWQLDAPAEVELTAPTLRFAHATRFEEDFLGDRVAVDRRDEIVRGAPQTLRVLPWPDAGRPAGFVDAVGRFAVRARAAPKDGDAAILQLTLTIEGEGNLQTLTPPSGDRLAGLHVYGAIDDKHPARRVITYDVAPLAGSVTSIPAISFAFLEPGVPARYRVVTTDPIPLVPPEETGESGANVGEPYDLQGWKLGLLAFAVVVLTVLLLVLGRGLRRNAAGDESAEREQSRLAEATDALRAAVTNKAADVETPLTAYLAAHLGIRPAAVIGPDLASRLAAAGLPRDLARRTAATVERLVAARYTGATATGAAALDPTLVEALISAWSTSS